MFLLKNKNRGSGGFTIVEALISILLLAITITGGMAIYFNAEKTLTLAMHKKIATEIASTSLEVLRAKTFEEIKEIYPVGPPYWSGEFYDENPPDVGDLPANRTLTLTCFPASWTPTYIEASIKISWTEAGQRSPREVIITSMLAPVH